MKNTYIFVAAVLSLGIFLGFSNSDNLPVTKTKANPNSIVETRVITSTDINNPVSTNGFEPYYKDNFWQREAGLEIFLSYRSYSLFYGFDISV